MAEDLTGSAVISVPINTPIPFFDSIPCNRGYVYHNNGTGIFTLRGIVNNGGCFARYEVEFTGNIAIPEGGEITPIATAITLTGEQRQGSRAIFTPAEVDQYGNVTSRATIDVPKGCCFTVAVEPVSGIVDDPTVTPTPLTNIVDGRVSVKRTA